MTTTLMRLTAVTLAFVLVAFLAWQVRADGGLVKFQEDFAEGMHYATVERGNVKEELFTSRAAAEPVKNGQPIPSGTVITLVDYRDGRLFRYVVMEKRTGWGADYPPEKRNGEWEFQAFNADRLVNRNENFDRCLSCHKSQAQQDFVFTRDRMKNAN
jgi:hypothetical protein